MTTITVNGCTIRIENGTCGECGTRDIEVRILSGGRVCETCIEEPLN
jgi:hypothetical protein